MRLTTRERQFRMLLELWLFLFGAGAVVTTAAAWVVPGIRLYSAEPMLVFAWFGQIVLFLCAWYVVNGIRDNERVTGALWWYKVVSGAAMLLMTVSRGPHSGSMLPAIGGGLLDFVMGAATLFLWLRARRSRYQREPLDAYAKVAAEEEPQGPAADAYRRVLIACTAVCGVGSLALFITLMALDIRKDSTFMIGSGNGVAVLACLAFAGLTASDAPRRRLGEVDVLAFGMLAGAVGLCFWVARFPLADAARIAFLAGGAVLGVCAIAALTTGGLTLRAQRPTRYLGAWLHFRFEKFSEVLIRGDVEVIQARELADKADTWLAALPSPRKLAIRLALIAIEYAPLLRGRTPMSRMGREERATYFSTAFRFGALHSLIKIRALIMLFYYSDPRGKRQIGYVELPERQRYRDDPGKFAAVYPDPFVPPPSGAAVSVDVCVVGSGAGGAVVAARLAAKGLKVVLIEEGPYLQRDRITTDFPNMQSAAYRDGGLLASSDFDLSLLQGRCVGGSTFLNNGILFEIPPKVLRAWDRLGCEVSREELAAAYARVRADLAPVVELKNRPDLVEAGSTLFHAGCRKLDKEVGWFEVNLGECVGCGYCTSGCLLGRKNSMDRTYVPKFLKAGGILYPETKANSIDHDGRRVAALRCSKKDGSELRIEARKVVVSCGTVHSSLLLQRSGITKNVGTRVSFNAGSWVYAEFKDPIDSWDGVQMCAYQSDPRFFIETFAMPPGAFAASMPGWFEDHFDNMIRYRYFAVAGALIPTLPVGTVRPSSIPLLAPVLSPLSFTLPISDLRKLRAGVREACRIWLAAGAERVLPAIASGVEFTHEDQLGRLDELVVEAEDISFGSAHPQGGNPMSDDPAVGAVGADFRVNGFDNLFVVDASLFPTAIGVNPQFTIMALADMAATRIQ